MPGVPTLHTSATVTNPVLADIFGVFELPPSVLVSRVDFSQRDTLKYSVVKVISAAEKFTKLVEAIQRVIERHRQWNDGQPDDVEEFPTAVTGEVEWPVLKKPAVALIFVRTVKQADKLSAKLIEAEPSFLTTAFHSQLQPGQKSTTLAAVNAAMLDAVVSTSALECGQDFGTVAEVIQAEQCSGLSSSAQGFGRAGGSSAFDLSEPGLATDLYHRIKLLSSLGPLVLAHNGKAEFLKRLRYLENTADCRLGCYCRHFGGHPPARCRGLCDICCNEGPMVIELLRLDEWIRAFCNSWTGVLAEYRRRYPEAAAPEKS